MVFEGDDNVTVAVALEIALSNVPYNVNVYFESLHEPFSAFVIVTNWIIYNFRSSLNFIITTFKRKWESKNYNYNQ